jgi:hypothetical protein
VSHAVRSWKRALTEPDARRDDEWIAHFTRLAAYCRDLTRLNNAIAHADRPVRHQRALRLQAMYTAYDQTLILAATELGIETAMHAPMRPASRLALEVELSLAGLRW